MIVTPPTVWIAANPKGEAFGVGYDLDGLGQLCGHNVTKRYPDGSTETVARLPGKRTFQAARERALKLAGGEQAEPLKRAA